MDEQELKALVSRITEQIIKQLKETSGSANEEQGVMVIVPAHVPDGAALESYLKKAYDRKLTYWLLEVTEPVDPDVAKKIVRTETDYKRLMSALKYYSDIVLAVPPLRVLGNIARGDDTGVVEQAFLKAVLWEKKVTVLLDFEKPKFRRGTFFETLSETLKAIEDMGASIVSLPLSVKKQAEENTLVTEADIADAARSGDKQVKCAPGAIVTPLARDRAKDLGIVIE